MIWKMNKMKMTATLMTILFLSITAIAIPIVSVSSSTNWYVDGALGTDDGAYGTGPGTAAFATIQYAIDHTGVQDGDTVIVAAGTYDEYVDITKPLTLSGQSGAIVKPTTGKGGIIIEINVDDVTVEGFEVDGSSLDYAWAGIGSDSGCTRVTIRNNVVHDIKNLLPADIYGLGIGLWRGDNNIYEDILIEGNTVYDTDRMGIYIGARIRWDQNYLLSTNNIIKDNVVHDTMLDAGETFPPGCGGIALDALKDTIVEGNIVYLTGTELNPMPGIFLAHGSSMGNLISGNEVYGQAYGIAIEIDRGDVDFGEDSPAPPTVQYNNIHDNSEYGLIVRNANGKTVDATLNWWGHASGPYHPTLNSDGTGDAVSDNVDFDPWLTLPFQFEDLKNEIQDLELPKGTENSLIVKLNAASNAFDRGDYEDSINILNAFINHVMAQSGKKITTENAEQLIGSAEVLIAYISTFFL